MAEQARLVDTIEASNGVAAMGDDHNLTSADSREPAPEVGPERRNRDVHGCKHAHIDADDLYR